MARAYADMALEVLERVGKEDDRSAARVRRWLNDAMHELDAEERWDYLFVSTTGTAPLTIADLDTIESVADVALLNPLVGVDRDALVRDVVDLTVAGQPAYWYKTAPTTIAVYPVSASTTLTVKYFKFGPDMAAATDTPLVPDRFRQAIVEKAAAKACREYKDYNGANECTAEYQRILQQMRESLLTAPSFQARTNYAMDD